MLGDFYAAICIDLGFENVQDRVPIRFGRLIKVRSVLDSESGPEVAYLAELLQVLNGIWPLSVSSSCSDG